MADKNLKLHVATSADVGGVDKTSASLKNANQEAAKLANTFTEATAATVKTDAAIRATDGATKGLAKSKRELAAEAKKAGKEQSQFGQNILQTAFFVDDLQYGVKGILNNIPNLTMALGMGAGAAGAVSILAVGFEVLRKQMGWFEEGAKTSTDELKKLAVETRDAAAAAREEERSINAAEKSLESHDETVRRIKEGYSDMAAEIDDVAKSRENLNRIVLAETDAEAALQLAQIEKLRLEGTITDQQAEQNSLAVKRQAEQKRFEVEQTNAQAKMEDLRRKSVGQTDVSNILQIDADNKEALGRDLLDSEGRKRAEADAKEAEAALTKAREKASSASPTMFVNNNGEEISAAVFYGNKAIEGITGAEMGDQEIVNPQFNVAQLRLEQAARRKAEADAILERDRIAREQSGFSDADELRKNVQEQRRASEESLMESRRMRTERERIGQTVESQRTVFPMQQQVQQIQSGNRVLELDKRDQEKTNAAKAKSAQDAKANFKSEGSDLLRVTNDFLSDDQTEALRRTIDNVADKRGNQEQKLLSYLRKLTAIVIQLDGKNSQVIEDIKTFETQLSNLRNAR